jgi:hypothetical protein
MFFLSMFPLSFQETFVLLENFRFGYCKLSCCHINKLGLMHGGGAGVRVYFKGKRHCAKIENSFCKWKHQPLIVLF